MPLSFGVCARVLFLGLGHVFVNRCSAHPLNNNARGPGYSEQTDLMEPYLRAGRGWKSWKACMSLCLNMFIPLCIRAKVVLASSVKNSSLKGALPKSWSSLSMLHKMYASTHYSCCVFFFLNIEDTLLFFGRDLSYNQFTGTLPKAWSKLTLLQSMLVCGIVVIWYCVTACLFTDD